MPRLLRLLRRFFVAAAQYICEIGLDLDFYYEIGFDLDFEKLNKLILAKIKPGSPQI